MKFSNYIFLIYISLLIYSCGDPHEYNVDPVFAKYVQRFEDEAAKRGKNFQLQTEGLIIEFSKLKEDQAGLCHYENPIRIEIDSNYWKSISLVAGSEYMKEDLIFHEMGHGILGRKHLNSTLPNGDWKSIMCGGTKVDNRPWNINYRRLRRDYYVDELFNESTPTPAFAASELPIDTLQYMKKIAFTFNTGSAQDTGWELANTADYTSSIDNKQFKFVSRYSASYAILLNIKNSPVNFMNNFSFEMEIDCQPQLNSDQFGMVYATKDTTEYFKINRDQKMYPGNSSWYSYHTQLHKNEIHTTGKNKLKLFKQNGVLYYFINNIYVYQSEDEIFGGGTNFGFVVPAKATIWIDNMQLGLKAASNIKSKTVSETNQTYDFSFSIVKEKDWRKYFEK